MEKYIQSFLKFKKSENLSKITLKSYESDLKQVYKYCMHNSYDIESGLFYYSKFLEETSKYKVNTKIRKLITIKMFYKYLSRFYKTNKEVYHFKIRKEKRLPKTLSHEEIQKLMNAIIFPETRVKQRDYFRDSAIINILVSLGLRICEVSNLNIQDYDKVDGKINIFGKNRKERILFLTNRTDKIIINDYLKVREQYNPKNEEKSFFLNKYGERLSIFSIENIFYKYRDMANINKKATPHYLRHSFATELLNNGASIRDIQELLGHSAITTTEIYVEVSSTRKKEVLSRYGYKK